MKNSILIITALAIGVNLSITSCDSSPKENGLEIDESLAVAELDKAFEEYAEDVQSFKEEAANRIAENNKITQEFKVRIESEKKEAKADYEKRIAKLEQKNTDMKKTLDEYKADRKENWESFKTEFNHDMDELGTAFRDLTRNNVD
jgi:outer membrane murein-binding lipoprotein Lpp